jgi:hypothetical protein
MNTNDILILAHNHLRSASPDRMISSAALCLSDAMALYKAGKVRHAKERAIKSLAYTVGVLHPSYRRAIA